MTVPVSGNFGDWSSIAFGGPFPGAGDKAVSGFAYNDINGDGLYSFGEGVGGVKFGFDGLSGTSQGDGSYSISHNQSGIRSVWVNGAGVSIWLKVQLDDNNATLNLVNGNNIQSSASMTLVSGVNDGTLLGQGDHYLTGHFKGNVLKGNAGDNKISGLDGNDTMIGGAGNDTIDGGNGTDTAVLNVAYSSVQVVKTANGVKIISAEGTDEFIGVEKFQFADKTLTYDALVPGGGPTNPKPTDPKDPTNPTNPGPNPQPPAAGIVNRGTNENDSILGNTGSDLLMGSDGFDTIKGGMGDDRLFGEGHADLIFGGLGNDFVDGGAGFDKIYGDEGNDTLFAGDSADRLYGGTGDDLLYGGTNFGTSVDGLWGGDGNDLMFGEQGHDMLDGGNGDDLLDGGFQADNLFGRGGEDTLRGGQGHDRLFAGDGNDFARGGSENDGLFGGAGDDTLNGESGDDRMFGEIGDDIMDGATGNDTLYGGAGFDKMIGGEGNDVLAGNFNADTFIFRDDHGNDTITDFDALNDLEKIDLSEVTAITSMSDLAANHMTQDGANVVIDTGDGNSITLNSVNISNLDGADFLF